MNRNLARGLLNIQYLIDPDVISLGGSYRSKSRFHPKGVKKAVDYFVDTYEEWLPSRTCYQACTYHADANLYGALVNWLQEGKSMVRFTGLSSKQTQAIDLLTKHISLTRCRGSCRSSLSKPLSLSGGEVVTIKLTYRKPPNLSMHCPCWQHP